MQASALLIASLAGCASAQSSPVVALHNAAAPGQTMPWIGLGTGGYGASKNSYGAYPECWMEIAGCGNYTIEAVKTYLALGGTRLDAADSYDTQYSVGVAMKESGVPRSSIFLLSKTGNWNPMGYSDTLSQFDFLINQMGTPYVDLTLNHWPTSPASPTVDPLCDPKKTTYDAKGCRLSTWSALVSIWKSGKSLAIGVANYGISDIQEIIDAGMPLPTVNQIPFHLYNAQSQMALIAFCKLHNIVVLSYSPLGIPDWHAYPSQMPARTTLEDPVLMQVAAAHGISPAQTSLAWIWSLGLPMNPRSMNVTHMQENLDAYKVTLTVDEIKALSNRPLDLCSFDASFYECVPTAGATPPPHPFAKRA